MRYLSQNDPRWKNKKLGHSRSTIGNFGCTITCIAMMTNRTTDEVNELLKANNGFVQGNLVAWENAGKATGFEWVNAWMILVLEASSSMALYLLKTASNLLNKVVPPKTCLVQSGKR